MNLFYSLFDILHPNNRGRGMHVTFLL